MVPVAFDIIYFQVFVGARLHVTGGVLKGGRSVEGEAAVAGNPLVLLGLIILKRHIYLIAVLFLFV